MPKDIKQATIEQLTSYIIGDKLLTFDRHLEVYLKIPGKTINDTNQKGQTLLMVAAYSTRSALILSIIMNNPTVVIDKQDESGYTALIWAIKGLRAAESAKESEETKAGKVRFYLSTITLLLKKGANPNILNRGGEPALGYIIQCGIQAEIELFKLLLLHKPEMLNDSPAGTIGYTPLGYAIRGNRKELARFLIMIKGASRDEFMLSSLEDFRLKGLERGLPWLTKAELDEMFACRKMMVEMADSTPTQAGPPIIYGPMTTKQEAEVSRYTAARAPHAIHPGEPPSSRSARP